MTAAVPGLRELMRAGVRRSVATEYLRLITAGVSQDAAEVLASGPLLARRVGRRALPSPDPGRHLQPIGCPVCSKRLLSKNLTRHLRHLHPQVVHGPGESCAGVQPRAQVQDCSCLRTRRAGPGVRHTPDTGP